MHWNYRGQHIQISIPNYKHQALHKFEHPLNPKQINSPLKYIALTYSTKIQYSNPESTTKLPPPSDIPHVQQVIGTLMYYAIEVDNTMIVALGDLVSMESKIKDNTMEAITHLFNYAATHPNVKIQYQNIGMILHIQRDFHYLSVTKSHSHVGRHFLISDNTLTYIHCKHNIPIHTIEKNLQKCHGFSRQGRNWSHLHQQTGGCTHKNSPHQAKPPTTPISNTSWQLHSHGVFQQKIKQKRSKSIYMSFYCLQYHIEQGHFPIYCSPGKGNLG